MSQLPDTRYSLLVRLGEPADELAWAEFLQIYEAAVLRYCQSCGLQEADARDVVQEVLVAVHRTVGQWVPSGRPGSFRAWLVQTAHRICLKTMRRQLGKHRGVGGTTVHLRLEEFPDTDSAAEADEREWQRWAFCWAAGQVQREIQPVTWQAFWLTAVDDQPPQDVARQLEIRVGSVYAARCRVLSRIRERIEDLSRSER